MIRNPITAVFCRKFLEHHAVSFTLIPPPAFVVKGCTTENSIATSSTLLLEVESIHTLEKTIGFLLVQIGPKYQISK